MASQRLRNPPERKQQVSGNPNGIVIFRGYVKIELHPKSFFLTFEVQFITTQPLLSLP